jgi:hypothetical protein
MIYNLTGQLCNDGPVRFFYLFIIAPAYDIGRVMDECSVYSLFRVSDQPDSLGPTLQRNDKEKRMAVVGIKNIPWHPYCGSTSENRLDSVSRMLWYQPLSPTNRGSLFFLLTVSVRITSHFHTYIPHRL